MTSHTARVIPIAHYREHRIRIRDRMVVEPKPSIARALDVECQRVTDECDHPLVFRSRAGADHIRATCIVCGRGLVFPTSWIGDA